MITFFAIPKAFKGHTGIIQENAIRSWTFLKPKPEILLFGNESGTKKFAEKLQIKNIPSTKKNQYNTPFLNDLFHKARVHSNNSYFGYVNADIILSSSFNMVFEKVRRNFKQFLIVGRRYDLNVTNKIDYSYHKWEELLKQNCESNGNLAGNGWIDYFIFTREIFSDIPPFAVGRTFWDKWLIWNALNNKIPVIDATNELFAVHQSHAYTHAKDGKKGVWIGPEAKYNIKLAGGWTHGATINESQYLLMNQKITKRSSLQRSLIFILNKLKVLGNISLLLPLFLFIRLIFTKKSK